MNIVFDLDDTLYSTNSVFYKTVKSITPDLDYDLPNFYALFREEGLKLFKDSQTGVLSMEEMHLRRVIQAYERIGIDLSTEQAKAFDTLYYKNKESISLDEDVIEVLQSLNEAGHTLGIITNGEHEKQTNTLSYLNMSQYIPKKTTLISGDLGIDKPDVRIFAEYEKMVDNSQPFLYIGDTFKNDVVGSHNAGWTPIWFNPHKKPKPSDLDCIEITQLSELLSMKL